MRKFEVLMLDSKELNRIVKIYVKLPNSYYSSENKYPVIYIHDGQVAFNDYEQNETSWGLLENYLDSPDPEAILVGIDSKDTRIDELLPFEVDRKEKGIIGGKADTYFKFITDTLIPLINETYRTNPDRESTGMLGISLGGFCTLYAMTKCDKHFSRFGIVSSAHHQFHDRLAALIQETDLSNISKVYQDIGTEEHEKESVKEKYLETNIDMHEVLKTKLDEEKYQFKVIEGSKHDFDYWNLRIPNIINYLLN